MERQSNLEFHIYFYGMSSNVMPWKKIRHEPIADT